MAQRAAHTHNCKGNVHLSSNVLLCSPSFPTMVFKHFINISLCPFSTPLSQGSYYSHFRGRKLGYRDIVSLQGHPRGLS